MSSRSLHTHVRAARQRRGWSQEELARRAGVSRAEVSAVETGRAVPSTAVALALARALEKGVEALFRLADEGGRDLDWSWAWPPRTDGRRFWTAEVFGSSLRFPVEATAGGTLAHDGLPRAGEGQVRRGRGTGAAGLEASDPRSTLVLAGCDPAVAVLAERLRLCGVRLLPFVRSSRRALELLAERRIHVAGIHLGETTDANLRVARRGLTFEPRLVHVAHWQEGVAIAPGLGLASAREVVGAGLRWVGREEGSGARECLDALLEGRSPPEGYDRVAADHRGVVETIRSGWAQAGVCVEIAAEEGGLDFLPVRSEAYDLCYDAELEDDPRIQAMVTALRSAAFRRLASDLPGYDTRRIGAIA